MLKKIPIPASQVNDVTRNVLADSLLANRVNFLRMLLLTLVITANLLHFQAFTFNMYSGRGSDLVITVMDRNQKVIYQSHFFEKSKISNFFFLAERVAREFCSISSAEHVEVDERGFKSYEC